MVLAGVVSPASYPGHIGAAVFPLPGSLPDALVRHGLPDPGVKAEDPVGLGDDMPALDVGERRAVCLPGLDVLGVHSTADRLPGGRPKPRFRKFFPNGFVS